MELQIPAGENYLIEIKAVTEGGDGSSSGPIRIPKMSSKFARSCAACKWLRLEFCRKRDGCAGTNPVCDWYCLSAFCVAWTRPLESWQKLARSLDRILERRSGKHSPPAALIGRKSAKITLNSLKWQCLWKSFRPSKPSLRWVSSPAWVDPAPNHTCTCCVLEAETVFTQKFVYFFTSS